MYLLSISEEILFYVCGLGILQGTLLAILLYFHPKSDRSVNSFLALHIFFLCIVQVIPFVMKFSLRYSFLVQTLPLLPGPMLYFYLRSFKEKITFRKVWPHLLPFFLFLGPVYWNITRYVEKYPGLNTVSTEALRDPITHTLIYTRLLLLLLYYFLSRKALISYQRSIQHLFSETSSINLKWARVLINGYLFVVVAGFVFVSLMFAFPQRVTLLLLIDMAIATPYIYIATFKGITQPSIWQTKPGITKEELVKEITEVEEMESQKTKLQKTKPVNTGYTDGKIGEIVKRITFLMEKEKLYQETELTVQQLAEKLEIPTYQVSQAINEGMDRNFYDLVNTYRVEEAKLLLLDPGNRNYTILSVGFEAGFNSKTTFNTVFKKFTGLTPTEFRMKSEAGSMKPA